MVLRRERERERRAAEPEAMASDHPPKKRQRTRPPGATDEIEPAPSTSGRFGDVPPPPPPPDPDPDGDPVRERLIARCLCPIGAERARAAFATRVDIAERPPDRILDFVSRLQLLFDVYLEQNREGRVCPGLIDACATLARNESDWFGRIVRLSEHRNPYVNFVACKAISSFLIVAKGDVDRERLGTILESVTRASDSADFANVNGLNFGLDAIKRVLEWKDAERHPLEEGPEEGPATAADATVAAAETPERCAVVTLSDSESFDTSHVKCLTIRCLERYWPALVDVIKRLLTRRPRVGNAENCILTFLSLWENIVSVKANLSVVDTKPFCTDFGGFVELLRYANLPPLVYAKLLGLFNEALCYGSTLALQDSLPEETCALAHSIVRFVKDFRLLDGVRPRRDRSRLGFVGADRGAIVAYRIEDSAAPAPPPPGGTVAPEESPAPDPRTGAARETDGTALQRLVLLVLKSVAVTVKEMRCDSSDSSIDSTDYGAIQDMQMVERSIRDVLVKLDAFLKRTLDFLPDSPLTKILVRLFGDQDDYLIESMVCTLDITVGIVYRNSAFPDLIPMLNPVATFVEFLEAVSYHSDVLLDYLVSNETCFLLYLLRFLKYVRKNWSKFVASCRSSSRGTDGLDDTMAVLTRLRLQINRLVALSLFPYNIGPVLKLLEKCEDLYEGNELS